MLGLNCLHPGRSSTRTCTADRTSSTSWSKAKGEFVVGDERRTAGEGMVVWAPADVSHGVVNTGDEPARAARRHRAISRLAANRRHSG